MCARLVSSFSACAVPGPACHMAKSVPEIGRRNQPERICLTHSAAGNAALLKRAARANFGGRLREKGSIFKRCVGRASEYYMHRFTRGQRQRQVYHQPGKTQSPVAVLLVARSAVKKLMLVRHDLGRAPGPGFGGQQHFVKFLKLCNTAFADTIQLPTPTSQQFAI